MSCVGGRRRLELARSRKVQQEHVQAPASRVLFATLPCVLSHCWCTAVKYKGERRESKEGKDEET